MLTAQVAPEMVEEDHVLVLQQAYDLVEGVVVKVQGVEAAALVGRVQHLQVPDQALPFFSHEQPLLVPEPTVGS